MDTGIVILIVCVIIILAATGVFGFRSKEGRIKDEYLTLDRFFNELSKFEMIVNPKRKQGFTEKDVQNELEKFFNKHFETVYREYALEGVNVKRIDFDIGKGQIGIEVKLAREMIKEGEWDRATGQINKYIKKKYTNGNLIVLVAGYEDENNSQKVKEFLKDIKEIGGMNTYVTINKKHVIKKGVN